MDSARSKGVFLAALIWVCTGASPALAVLQKPVLKVGNHVPPLFFTDMKGREHSEEWPVADSKATVVLFFEPRSPSSLLAVNYLHQVYRHTESAGMRVYAVEASGLKAAEVGEAMERYQRVYPPPSYPIVPDPDYKISGMFGVRKVPSMFIIESHGVIMFQMDEFSPEQEETVTARIMKILRLPDGFFAGAPGVTEAPAASREKEDAAGSVPMKSGPLIEGDRAPDLAMKDLEGNSYSIQWPSSEAKINVFFFWGALCLPCMMEMTYLDQIYQEALKRGLRIFAVQASGLDLKQTTAVMKRYKRFYPYPSYPIIIDPEFKIGAAFGIKKGGPATYFINSAGTVTFETREFVQGAEAKMTKRIEEALKITEGSLETAQSDGIKEREETLEDIGESTTVLTEVKEDRHAASRQRGDELYDGKSYREALLAYEECVDVVEDDVHCRKMLARIYQRLKLYAKARYNWEWCLRYDASDEEALRELNSILRKKY